MICCHAWFPSLLLGSELGVAPDFHSSVEGLTFANNFKSARATPNSASSQDRAPPRRTDPCPPAGRFPTMKGALKANSQRRRAATELDWVMSGRFA